MRHLLHELLDLPAVSTGSKHGHAIWQALGPTFHVSWLAQHKARSSTDNTWPGTQPASLGWQKLWMDLNGLSRSIPGQHFPLWGCDASIWNVEPRAGFTKLLSKQHELNQGKQGASSNRGVRYPQDRKATGLLPKLTNSLRGSHVRLPLHCLNYLPDLQSTSQKPGRAKGVPCSSNERTIARHFSKAYLAPSPRSQTSARCLHTEASPGRLSPSPAPCDPTHGEGS